MLAVRSNISRGNRTLRQKAQGNHNLEQQAQALYKSWFVDFEPFRGGNFVDYLLQNVTKENHADG